MYICYNLLNSNIADGFRDLNSNTADGFKDLNSNTADGFRDPLKMGSLNPSAVLEFSKMYKFIVKFVIFFIARVTTKNDQLLCGHF